RTGCCPMNHDCPLKEESRDPEVAALKRSGGVTYFLIFFLSCFGFLTSFLRTLFPLPMSNSFGLCLPPERTHWPATLRQTRSYTTEDRICQRRGSHAGLPGAVAAARPAR